MTMNERRQAGNRRGSTVRVVPALIFAVVMTLVATGCGGSDSPDPTSAAEESGPVAHGRQLAEQSCATCHGQEFEGVKNVGPALRDNHFIEDHTDDELIEFIKEGRSKGDPDSETGMAMPPYGGNPRLTDADLADIVLFLRTLQ